jgi:hypothetical protein
MVTMRLRFLIAITACGTAIAGATAAVVEAASPVAINSGASQIMATTAVLNGSVHTTDPAAGDSAWAFEYGTTTAYGHSTKAVLFGPSRNGGVSAEITGLTPGTQYHFELLVAEGVNYSPTFSASSDLTFTTAASTGGGGGKKYGTASLKRHHLTVSHGSVSIPFSCTGVSGATCKGKVAISARGKIGKQMKTVKCGGGKFSATAGTSKVVKGGLSKGCKTLLHSARHNQLGATLRATFSTHQSSLKTPVTLAG